MSDDFFVIRPVGTVPVEPKPAVVPVAPPVVTVVPATPSSRPSFLVVLAVLAALLSLGGQAVTFYEAHHHPSPAPAPAPVVPPKPAVVTAPLHATLVYDKDKDAFTTALLRSDATLAPSLAALQCDWYVILPDDADKLKFTPFLKDVGTPALVIQLEGDPAHPIVQKAPPTADGVLELVRKLRGK